jgi:hypothetical protein
MWKADPWYGPRTMLKGMWSNFFYFLYFNITISPIIFYLYHFFNLILATHG